MVLMYMVVSTRAADEGTFQAAQEGLASKGRDHGKQPVINNYYAQRIASATSLDYIAARGYCNTMLVVVKGFKCWTHPPPASASWLMHQPCEQRDLRI